MDFLNNLGFEKSEIEYYNEYIPEKMYSLLVQNEKLVTANIKYLQSLNIPNYKEVFKKFYELFLLDHSTFIEKFDTYETEDLIEYLKRDVNVVEYL